MKLPVLGETIAYMRSPVDWARDRYDRFCPVSSVPMSWVRMTAALGPDATEEVLLNRDKAFSNGGGWETFIGRYSTATCCSTSTSICTTGGSCSRRSCPRDWPPVARG